MNEADIAWVAGILEGEGSFVWNKNPYGTRYPYITVAMTDSDTIQRVHSIIGGSYYHRKFKDSRKDVYVVQLRKFEPLYDALKLLYPYMSKRRKLKMDEQIENMERRKYGRVSVT